MRWLVATGLALAVGNVLANGLDYRIETRATPRPLRIHILQVDLTDKNHELAVAVTDDPDGDGPAKARLMDPQTLAAKAHFIAAVNANAFRNLSGTPKDKSTDSFMAGDVCDVLGWVVADGVLRSLPEQGFWSFWLDTNGQGHISSVKEAVPARLAVSGFFGLLRDGKVLPNAGGTLHPRTALGLDAEGRRLTLVVVDGRRPGFSEGMSEYELAGLMDGLGCRDALNLDGGGSSAMLMTDPAGLLQIVNRPSEKSGPRPVPVIIGVRKSQ